MSLYSKEIADRLYAEGKMPEWFYRQHYKTFQENWVDSHNKTKQIAAAYYQQKEIEAAAEKAIEKVIQELEKTIFK